MVKIRQADMVHKMRLYPQLRDETRLAPIAGGEDGTHVVTTAGVVRAHRRRKNRSRMCCATACCRLTVMNRFVTGIC